MAELLVYGPSRKRVVSLEREFVGFNMVLNFWVEAVWESENKGSLYFPT